MNVQKFGDSKIITALIEASGVVVDYSIHHFLRPSPAADYLRRAKGQDQYYPSGDRVYIPHPRKAVLRESFRAIAENKGFERASLSDPAKEFLKQSHGAAAFQQFYRRQLKYSDDFGPVSNASPQVSFSTSFVYIGSVLPCGAATRLASECQMDDLWDMMRALYHHEDRGIFPSFEALALCPVVLTVAGDFSALQTGDQVYSPNLQQAFICGGGRKDLVFCDLKTGKQEELDDWPDYARYGHPKGKHTARLVALERAAP